MQSAISATAKLTDRAFGQIEGRSSEQRDTIGTEQSSAAEIVRAARNGQIVALVDCWDRSQHAHFYLPAQFTTPATINFLARFGRGLVCLALDSRRAIELELDLQARRNCSHVTPQFAVSIEACNGVTTGISAFDRARTISVAIDGANGPEALQSPGHVFPIIAAEGGVLERPGIAETAVDIARLAGLNSSGVVCSILGPSGDPAGLSELDDLSRQHGFLIGSISDLVVHRCQFDPHIEYLGVADLATSVSGTWKLHSFRDPKFGWEAIAIQLEAGHSSVCPALYLNSVSILAHVPTLGDASSAKLHRVMRWMAERGSGVVVLQGKPKSLNENISKGECGISNSDCELIVASQILAQIGIQAGNLIGGDVARCEKLTKLGVAAQPITILDDQTQKKRAHWL